MLSDQPLRNTNRKRSHPHFARCGWMGKTPAANLFAVVSSISGWSNHGAWGLAVHCDSKPADYPKLAATLEWAKKHGQPVECEK
jgi:hypothetical protein